MDGLKEIRQGAALPAVDAACPGSLEISGHCLAAARVIASLLVGPEKKRAQDKRVMYKTGGKKRRRQKKREWKSTLGFFSWLQRILGQNHHRFYTQSAVVNGALESCFNNKSQSYDQE